MKALLMQFLPYLLVLLGGLFVNYVAPVLPGLTQKFFTWMDGHAKTVQNAYVKGLLDRLITLAGQKVLALENTEIETLKDAVASGKVTPADLPGLLAKVKQGAIDSVKADATAQGLWALAVQIFLGNEGQLVSWLGGVVESQVSQLPPSGLQSTTTAGVPAAVAQITKATPVVPQPAAPSSK